MAVGYKVGLNSFFGKLLAEAVKHDDSTQIVSLYEIAYITDETEYEVITWEIPPDGREFRANTARYTELDLAREYFASHAFGITTE